jgi:hypothetical protein
MQSHWVDIRQSGGVEADAASFASCGTVGTGGPRRADLSRRAARFAALLLAAVAGCAARAPHPDAAEARAPANLPERIVKQLVTVWEGQLGRYIREEGAGDPAVLAQARPLHSRDVLRPARITFDALDVDAEVPSRDGWDVQGLLIGKQSTGTRSWYVFLVGIVSRAGYRPVVIQDIRLVALSARSGRLSWVMSQPDRNAVQRYWETFHGAPVVRFPGEADEFIMKLDEDRAWVLEVRSGASWSLPRSADDFTSSQSGGNAQPSTPRT